MQSSISQYQKYKEKKVLTWTGDGGRCGRCDRCVGWSFVVVCLSCWQKKEQNKLFIINQSENTKGVSHDNDECDFTIDNKEYSGQLPYVIHSILFIAYEYF